MLKNYYCVYIYIVLTWQVNSLDKFEYRYYLIGSVINLFDSF